MKLVIAAILFFAIPGALISCAGPATTDEPPQQWRPLFDGRALENWEILEFGGEGRVAVEENELHLHPGETLTGVRWSGPLGEILPQSQDRYEIRLHALRARGTDFFCGLTFPVGRDGRVTLILGGWGGSLVGLSCLDGDDASDNETTTYRRFEKNRWYRVRARVSAEAIECWVDDERVVVVQRSDHEKLTLRAEVIPTDPIGRTTFQSHGVFRDIEVRRLSAN